MNWREYDERAIQIAEKLRAKAPLIDWRAVDASSLAPYWRKAGLEDFSTYQIQARVRVNDKKLVGSLELSADLVGDMIGDGQVLVDYIVPMMAREIAERIMEWTPETEEAKLRIIDL